MVVVPLAAARRAGVAFAMIRSTFFAISAFTTVVQSVASPAMLVSNLTVLPAFSISAVSASIKPFVAASRESCSIS